MAGWRVGAHPVLGAGIESLPGGGARQRPHQGRLTDVLHAGLAGAGVGDHGHDQPAALVVSPRLRQLTLGRIHHAMNLPGHDADRRLHARGVDLDVHEAQQVADMPIGAVTMQALEAADGPVVVGLEIGRAAVHFARVLLHPGAGDVVLALAQRRLVQATVPQCGQNAVLLGARYPDRIAVTRPLLRGARALPLGSPGRRHLQLKAIDQFLDRIAQLGRPLDHPTRERRRVLAVHRHRQPGQPRPRAIRAGVAQPGGDDGIHQPVGGGAIGQRFAQQIPGLMIARRCLHQPGRRQRQPLHGHLGAHVIQHDRMQGMKARLLPPDIGLPRRA